MERYDDGRRPNTTPWPFPVGSWVLPTFWLVVVVIATLLWWFR